MMNMFIFRAHNVYVDDIMVREIVYVWQGATYREIKGVLKSNKRLQSFPLVESSGKSIVLIRNYFVLGFYVVFAFDSILLFRNL